jgi:hypothetical protein
MVTEHIRPGHLSTCILSRPHCRRLLCLRRHTAVERYDMVHVPAAIKDARVEVRLRHLHRYRDHLRVPATAHPV